MSAARRLSTRRSMLAATVAALLSPALPAGAQEEGGSRARPRREPPARRPRNAAEWRQQLSAALNRRKRYPLALRKQHRREDREPAPQGTSLLSFTVDRRGTVLSAEISRSSGIAAFDEAALAMVPPGTRLPPMPPDVVGESHRITVPIVFTP